MRAIIQRDRSLTDKAVLGSLAPLWVPSAPTIRTGEPLECIPAGIYDLIGHQGPHKFNVWEVSNVPGHTGVLIHEGNFPVNCIFDGIARLAQSHACILIGRDVNLNIPMVLDSDETLLYLQHIFGIKARDVPMNITLEIRD